MTKTISISVYWNEWLTKVVNSGVRKSKAEIVEEGLKSIRLNLESEVLEFEDARAYIRGESTEEERKIDMFMEPKKKGKE